MDGLAATGFVAAHESVNGTDLPTSALQRFRPESGGQLTCVRRGREDRS
jgi:hypothetical protein